MAETATADPSAAAAAPPAAAAPGSAAPAEDLTGLSPAELLREAGVPWREFLPEHVTGEDGKPTLDAQGRPVPLRGSKALEKFKDQGSLALAYLNLERRLSEATTIPGKDAKPEELAAFREKLGVPKDVAGYADVKLQEVEGLGPVDPTMVNGFFKPAALKIGLTPSQSQDVLNLFAEYTVNQRRAAADAMVTGQEALRHDWGLNFDRNVTLAKQALQRYAPPAFLKLLADSQLDMHPDAIRMFHTIGQQLAEDGLIDGSVRGGLTPEEVQQQITATRAELAKVTEGSRRYTELKEQLDTLYRTKYGTGAA